LMIAYVPHYRANSNNVNPFQTLYTASGLPHVLLSAQVRDMPEITIGFVGGFNWYDLEWVSSPPTGDGFLGKIAVYVEHPLSVQGSTTTPSADLAVMAWFEDVELEGPGLRVATVPAIRKAIKRAEEREEEKDRNLKMVSQSGLMGGEFGGNISTATKEANMKTADGTVSSVKESNTNLGMNVSVIPAGGKGGVIPALTKLVNAVGNVIHKKRSKPTSPEVVHKNKIMYSSNMATGSGLDNSEVLAMDAENMVSTDISIFGDPVDYDLFDNYKLLPGLIMTGEILQSNVVDDKLMLVGCNPGVCHQYSDVTFLYFERTHVGQLANMFKYWRGGLNYCLDLFTSQYISCRVQVLWNPDATFTAAIIDAESGDTVSSWVDVKGHKRLLINIPYNKKEPWLLTGSVDQPNITPITDDQFFNGQIYMKMINPINSSDPTGTVKVYWSLRMSGDKDFEVAYPLHPGNLYSDGTDGSKPIFVGKSQSGEISDMRTLFRTGNFIPLVPAKTRVTTGLQMGERVSSWTELWKRFGFYRVDTIASPTGAIVQAPWDQLFKTTFSGTVTDQKGNNAKTTSFTNLGTLGLTLRTFNFARGSLRFKFLLDGYTASTNNCPIIAVTGLWDASENSQSVGWYYQRWDQNPLVEVQMPFYLTENFYCEQFVPDGECNNQPDLYIGWFSQNSSGGLTSVTCTTYIAVADDFSVGCPLAPIVLKRSSPVDDNNASVSRLGSTVAIDRKPAISLNREKEFGTLDRRVSTLKAQ
jgi:hypothetical protein